MPWRQTDTLKCKTYCPKSYKKKKKYNFLLNRRPFSIWNLYSPFLKESLSQQCNKIKNKKNHTSSLSIAIWTDWICGLSWDPSFMVTEVAITGRDTPHARPRACLERTNTYGTFLSSHSSGRWRMISSGSASAAITINSEMPLFRVFVAGE